MQKLSFYNLSTSAAFAAVSAVVIIALTLGSFLLAEPQITHGQSDTADFYIRQTILDETQFITEPANVTMVGTVYGLSGGNATGTTQFAVRSTNASGYIVNIAFEDNPGAEAMYGDVDGDESIRDYADNAGEPTYGFTPQAYAQFAYTVTSSTTSDTDPSFLHNGTNACNTGAVTTADICWKAPETGDFTIIDRGTSAITGATSSIKFRVNVPNGAVPTPSAQTYTATATLSVYTQ